MDSFNKDMQWRRLCQFIRDYSSMCDPMVEYACSDSYPLLDTQMQETME